MNQRFLLFALFICIVLLTYVDGSGEDFSDWSDFWKKFKKFLHEKQRQRKYTSSGGSLSVEQRLLKLTNEARSSGRYCGDTYYPAAQPLVWHSALSRASKLYAHEMSETANLSHDPNLGDLCSTTTENVGEGYRTPESVFGRWLQSPTNCANLMDKRSDSFGAGKVGIYWVVRLGYGCS